MSKHSLSRRDMLVRSARLVPLCALLPLTARAAPSAETVCEMPDAADMSLRSSLHYMEVAPDPQKTCKGCGLFEPAEEAPCGRCMMFNGPTNPQGHCDSWTAKN